MRHETGVCAKCGSSNIRYGKLKDTGDYYVYYPIVCRECGARSEERYDLVHIGTYAEGEDK
jgi:ribosomal protein L40E